MGAAGKWHVGLVSSTVLSAVEPVLLGRRQLEYKGLNYMATYWLNGNVPLAALLSAAGSRGARSVQPHRRLPQTSCACRITGQDSSALMHAAANSAKWRRSVPCLRRRRAAAAIRKREAYRRVNTCGLA